MIENNKKIKLKENSRSNILLSNNSNSVKENSVSKTNNTNHKYSEEVKKHNDSMTSSVKKNYASYINTSKNEAKNSSINQYPNYNVHSQDPENNNILIVNNESVQSVSKEDIKEKCMKIFMNYAKFNANDKAYFINQQNLIKLLKELNVLDNIKLKTSDIDIIFKKVNTFDKKIHFQQLMDIIVHIAKRADHEGFKNNQKDCIRDLILNMWSAFTKKEENSELISYQQDESIISLNHSKNLHYVIDNFVRNYEMDNKIIIIINDIYYTIKDIYLIYFNSEVNLNTERNKIINNSFEGLTEFMKEFEIVPYLCNMNNLKVYWDYLLNISPKDLTKNKIKFEIFDDKKDVGRVFTLSKFSALLVYLAIFSFNKSNPLSIDMISEGGKYLLNKEKLLLFLERLENSKGLKNLLHKTFKPYSAKMTFIPSKEVIISLNPSLLKKNDIFFKPENLVNSSKELSQSLNSEIFNDINNEKIKEFNDKTNNNQQIQLRNFLVIGNDAYSKLENRLEMLSDLFFSYCKIGDKVNNFKLNATSYLKFLKDCEVISDLKNDLKKNPLMLTNRISERSKHSTFSPIKTKSSERVISQSQVINHNIDLQSEIYGKIEEKEVPGMFFSLTGYKNFDNSIKIKAQFDKNFGYSPNILNNKQNVKIEKDSFININSKSVPMKMDFNLFIKSFEFLVRKLYKNKTLDEAFIYFIENDVSKAFMKREHSEMDKASLTNLLKSLRRDDIIDLLKDIHPVIHPHYLSFSEPNSLMNFNGFLEFYKSFSLFPDMISLVKMKNIFFTLSDLFDQFFNHESSDKHKQSSDYKILHNPKNYINYSLFLDSLALTANLALFQENYNEIEKILYIIECMNQSNGINLSMKRTGETLTSNKDFSNHLKLLKKKYTDFYKKKIEELSKKDVMKFNSIFDA